MFRVDAKQPCLNFSAQLFLSCPQTEFVHTERRLVAITLRKVTHPRIRSQTLETLESEATNPASSSLRSEVDALARNPGFLASGPEPVAGEGSVGKKRSPRSDNMCGNPPRRCFQGCGTCFCLGCGPCRGFGSGGRGQTEAGKTGKPKFGSKADGAGDRRAGPIGPTRGFSLLRCHVHLLTDIRAGGPIFEGSVSCRMRLWWHAMGDGNSSSIVDVDAGEARFQGFLEGQTSARGVPEWDSARSRRAMRSFERHCTERYEINLLQQVAIRKRRPQRLSIMRCRPLATKMTARECGGLEVSDCRRLGRLAASSPPSHHALPWAGEHMVPPGMVRFHVFRSAQSQASSVDFAQRWLVDGLMPTRIHIWRHCAPPHQSSRPRCLFRPEATHVGLLLTLSQLLHNAALAQLFASTSPSVAWHTHRISLVCD